MKFKLFKFDADDSKAKRIATYVCFGLVVVWFIVAYFSVWGIFNNALSKMAATATGGESTLGFILLLAAGGWFYINWWDKIPFRVGGGMVQLVTGLLLVFSLLAYCGFGNGVY